MKLRTRYSKNTMVVRKKVYYIDKYSEFAQLE